MEWQFWIDRGGTFTDVQRTVYETVREAAEFIGLGGRGPVLVGDPKQIADQLEMWQDETGIDGFNLARTVVPESYEHFIDLVVPELQRRGLFRTAYEGHTLRDHLDLPHVPNRHFV